MTEEKKKSEFEAIKDISSPQLKNQLLSSAEDALKHHTEIFIVSAFSIIVFLLSLITERTLFLEIGILFLVLSILMNLQLSETPFIIRYYSIADSKKVTKLILLMNLSGKMGNNFFIFGLAYLLGHFNLWLIIIILIAYINLGYVISILFLIRRISEMKSNIQLKKSRKYFLHQMVPMEIISFTLSIFFSILIFYIN